MKRRILLLLILGLLGGCASRDQATQAPTQDPFPVQLQAAIQTPVTPEHPFESRFREETPITLSDNGIQCSDPAVFESRDILYYEDRDQYESGNPYGEGTAADRHSAQEAAAHLVVNITRPGRYRLTGTLSAGQIRVDLGKGACEDPEAVVELILDNAAITCSVAPAILFQNVYECDGGWAPDKAQPQVDTQAAGAVLVLAEGTSNQVTGSYVARIYKDKPGGKKLWKQDGAIYSYMSMNVYGPGRLDLTAANEGLDTELHLTINGGDLRIYAQNDGINTNEDGVSVTTINAGSLHIVAGLGAEGDGIDSNGYLVINGGAVVASANPASDAGLDSDLGSFVNGGTVLALGSTMDWAESDSAQVTMNLQFAARQSSGSAIVVKDSRGAIVFAYDPSADEVLGSHQRPFMGAILSTPLLRQGGGYTVWLDGTVTGQDAGGIYDLATITDFTGGIRQIYAGTDVGGFPGGRPGMEGLAPPAGGDPGQRPTPPEGEPPANRPDGPAFGRGESPGGPQPGSSLPGNSLFHMADKVNAFSGVAGE